MFLASNVEVLVEMARLMYTNKQRKINITWFNSLTLFNSSFLTAHEVEYQMGENGHGELGSGEDVGGSIHGLFYYSVT